MPSFTAEPGNFSSNNALPVVMASALAACLLLASVSPTRANLVTDPGFESCTTELQGPPPGWTGNAVCHLFFPHSGSWAASLGFVAGSNTLSQSITTTVGDMYEFSFWLENVTATPPDAFTASFGSDTVLNLTNVNSFFYTFEDFTVSAVAAGTTISFATSAQTVGEFFLDDVSVTAIPVPAPEPSSGGLLFGAIGLLAFAVLPKRHVLFLR
jgi:hypothetical protein